MALGPLPPVRTTPPAQPAASTDVRTAAQRAFFQAALGRAGVANPADGSAGTAVAPHVTPLRESRDTASGEPPRSYRPGSLLDIKV